MDSGLRVVLVSQEPLPYVRVERIIYSLLKNDWKVYLIAKYSGHRGITDFSKVEIIQLPMSLHGLITLRKSLYRFKVKKAVSKIVKKINPDVVIAYDLYSAIIVNSLGYPVIFDDAEYFSIKLFSNINTLAKFNRFKYLLNMYYIAKCLKWEQRFALELPVVTVSRLGYVHYKYTMGAKRVCLLPNFPTKNELKYTINPWEHINTDKKHPIIFNYMGGELLESYTENYISKHKLYRTYGNYYRRMVTLAKILHELHKRYRNKFYVTIIGKTSNKAPKYIKLQGYKETHQELFQSLKGVHYGLLTYDPHEFHHWASANRTSIYGVNGIIPIISSSFTNEYHFYRKHAIFIDVMNFEKQLKEALEYIIDRGINDELIEQMRKLAHYSRNQTIWDNYDKCLLDLIRLI